MQLFSESSACRKEQIAITLNPIVGGIPINQRLGFNVGLGYQRSGVL
jgi:hypothetical protein